jgi:large subunit ribosomal protein L22
MEKNILNSKNFSAVASLSMVTSSPMRTRWVADLIRGKTVEDASRQLFLARKKSAEIFRKLLLSAVSNAEQKGVADLDRLFIKTVVVDEGPRIKRFMPRAQGRADRRLTRTSNIFLGLAEKTSLSVSSKTSSKTKKVSSKKSETSNKTKTSGDNE